MCKTPVEFALLSSLLFSLDKEMARRAYSIRWLAEKRSVGLSLETKVLLCGVIMCQCHFRLICVLVYSCGEEGKICELFHSDVGAGKCSNGRGIHRLRRYPTRSASGSSVLIIQFRSEMESTDTSLAFGSPAQPRGGPSCIFSCQPLQNAFRPGISSFFENPPEQVEFCIPSNQTDLRPTKWSSTKHLSNVCCLLEGKTR